MSSNGSTPSPIGRPSGPPTAVNPESTGQFRRESWWQVIFPVLLTAVLGITGVVLVAIAGPEAASAVAGLSLSLMILLALVVGLVFVALFIGLIYLVGQALKIIPPYTNVAHESMSGLYKWVDVQSTRVASGIIAAKSFLTGMQFYMQQQGIIPKQEEEGEDITPTAEQPAVQTTPPEPKPRQKRKPDPVSQNLANQ